MLFLGRDPVAVSLLDNILTVDGLDLQSCLPTADHNLLVLPLLNRIDQDILVDFVLQNDVDEFALHVGQCYLVDGRTRAHDVHKPFVLATLLHDVYQNPQDVLIDVVVDECPVVVD